MRGEERLPAQRDAVAAVPEQIETHARTVVALSERVVQAAGADTLMSLDSAADGQMCAFLPRLMAPLAGDGAGRRRRARAARAVVPSYSTGLSSGAASTLDRSAADRKRPGGWPCRRAKARVNDATSG